MVSAGVGQAGAVKVGESILNLRRKQVQDSPYPGWTLLRTVVNRYVGRVERRIVPSSNCVTEACAML